MTVPVGYVLRPTARDDAINACIDAYLLAQRKAAAWDWLYKNIQSADLLKVPELIACMDGLLENPPEE